MQTPNLLTLFSAFLSAYDAAGKDALWQEQSRAFLAFWKNRIVNRNSATLLDTECDEIISFLDRNAKGNTKKSEAVAKAMIAQGAWRRMFHEFRANESLERSLTAVLEADSPEKRCSAIDALYEINKERRNSLTGPSGNAVNAFLALSNPVQNLSIISLKDRKVLLEFLGISLSFDWDSASIGKRIVESSERLVSELRARGLSGSARTLSVYCYWPTMCASWKAANTVKRVEQDVDVFVPMNADVTDVDAPSDAPDSVDDIRESMQMQALLAEIGTKMGFSIWLPRADRGRVLRAWAPRDGELLDELPLGYDSTTLKTIEQIDVIWLKHRTIVRAFEVEHTTSVYSGLLRMADLIALQPNLKIKLHIVAPDSKRKKVLQEIRRPVFALLEGCPLCDLCTFLSYSSLNEIAGNKLLSHLSDSVIEDYQVFAGPEEE